MDGHGKASGKVDESLAERLVNSEAHDGRPKRVHRQFLVLHGLPKDIGDAGCPSFPFEFRVIRGIGVHLLKLDPGRIRRLPQIVKDNVLYLDIDIRKRAFFDVCLDDVVLAFLLYNGTLNVAIQEVKRVRLVPLDSEAIAAEVELRPARKVILVLRLLGAVLEVAIVDRFGLTHIVNPYDHRVHIPTTKSELPMAGENVTEKKRPGRGTIPPEEKFLGGRGEAAGMLSSRPRAIDYLVANKLLTARRIGARVLIPVADLRRFSRGDHPARLAG